LKFSGTDGNAPECSRSEQYRLFTKPSNIKIRNKFEFQIKKAQTDFAQGLGDLTKNNLINRLHLPIQVILSVLNQNNSFQTCVDSFWHLIYVFKFEVQRSLKKDTL